MGWEVIVLLIAGGILYKLKSIHIDFGGKDGDDADDKGSSSNTKQISPPRSKKRLKK